MSEVLDEPDPEVPPTGTFVYKARHTLRVGDSIYYPGDEIPEAIGWFRLASWVHAGFVVLVQTTVQEWFGAKQRVPLPPDEADWEIPPYYRFDSQQLEPWGGTEE
jgi:hypothetical protein